MTTDAAPVYTSEKPELFWLDFFWEASRDVSVNRIALLKLLAGVQVERDELYHEVRYADHKRISTEACFGCRSQSARLYVHHIVQVQHGGSNTPRNLVPLCGDCHGRVHPWLPTQRVVRGWWHIGDLVEQGFQKIGLLLRQGVRK